jgi:FkbM family methyltransferase
MSESQGLPSFNALTGRPQRIKVVDIGANPLFESPYLKLLKSGDAEVVGFEPNPEALAKLNAAKGANETYLPYAIGDGARHILNVCFAPGMTSLLTPNPAVLNLFHGFPAWSKIMETVEVETKCLDDIPELVGTELLHMDIQGAELMALKHAEQRLKDVLVIQTEAEFLQMYIDQPLFSDIEIHLRQRGFVFHRFYPTVSRVFSPMIVGNDILSGLSQLLWADAVFVRDFTRLDLLTETQLLKTAMILHDCYQSFDLALRLLTEVDARSGTQLGNAYLAGLVSGQPQAQPEVAQAAAG